MLISKSNSKRQKLQGPVLVEPDQGELARLVSCLEPFDPLDLREIVEDAIASPGLTPEKVRAARTAPQIKQVLGVLGFRDKKPPDWSRAFYRLAEVLLGVGHVLYTPSRRNRAAAKWDDAELPFIGMMYELMEAGRKQGQAIDAIAADPTKWSRLPYKQTGLLLYGGKKEQSKRAAALRRHWNRMKKKWPKDSYEWVFGPKEWPKSPLHRKLLEFELGPLAGGPAGDKRDG